MVDDAYARELYDLSMSDGQIGAALGVSTATARRWRLRSGLPVNYAFGSSASIRRAVHGRAKRLSALAAVRWPDARTPREADLLDAVSLGSCTMAVLLRRLGYLNDTDLGASRARIRLAEMVRRGVVVRGVKERNRRLYALAPGVESAPTEPTDWGTLILAELGPPPELRGPSADRSESTHPNASEPAAVRRGRCVRKVS